MDLFNRVHKRFKLFSMDKYAFKKGDLVQQLIPHKFPDLEKDAHFLIIDARGNVENITVEIKEKSIFCVYHFQKSKCVEFFIFKEGDDFRYQYNLTERFAMALAKNGIKADDLVSQQVHRIAIMIALIQSSEVLRVKISAPFSVYGNAGEVNLISLKTALSRVINAAYPIFKDQDLEFDKPIIETLTNQ